MRRGTTENGDINITFEKGGYLGKSKNRKCFGLRL